MRFALTTLGFASAVAVALVLSLTARPSGTGAHVAPPTVTFDAGVTVVSDPDGLADDVAMPSPAELRLSYDLHDGGVFILAGDYPWQHIYGTFSGGPASYAMLGYGGGDEYVVLFEGSLEPDSLSGSYQLTVDDRDLVGYVEYAVQSSAGFAVDFSTPTPTPTATPTTPQPTATPTTPAPTSTPTAEQPVNTPTSPAPATPTSQLWQPGDVTEDGRTNSVDAAIVLQLSAGVLSESDLSAGQRQRADVNVDGAITAVDAQLVLQYSAGFIDSLPV